MSPSRRRPLQRLAHLALAIVAWLLVASGVARSFVVCTEACGAQHLTLAHAEHGGAHGLACGHDHGSHDHEPAAAHGTNAADEQRPHADGCGDCDDQPLPFEPVHRPDHANAPRLPGGSAFAAPVAALAPPLLRPVRAALRREPKPPPRAMRCPVDVLRI